MDYFENVFTTVTPMTVSMIEHVIAVVRWQASIFIKWSHILTFKPSALKEISGMEFGEEIDNDTLGESLKDTIIKEFRIVLRLYLSGVPVPLPLLKSCTGVEGSLKNSFLIVRVYLLCFLKDLLMLTQVHLNIIGRLSSTKR